MATDGRRFDRSVFVNCPFDDDYQPILQAILFCLIDCELVPRIASERLDSGEARLGKIVELIRACRYSIHDLSRVQAEAEGEYARLNMPFELGIDFGFAKSGSSKLRTKRLLVVAEHRHKYRTALSDIAGWDIQHHDSEYEKAMRAIRSWLASNDLTSRSPSQLTGAYVDFQGWDYERHVAAGWNEGDIQDRKTPEVLKAMHEWVKAGRPVTIG